MNRPDLSSYLYDILGSINDSRLQSEGDQWKISRAPTSEPVYQKPVSSIPKWGRMTTKPVKKSPYSVPKTNERYSDPSALYGVYEGDSEDTYINVHKSKKR